MISALQKVTVLTRVLREVIGDTGAATCDVDPKWADTARADLVSRDLPGRNVTIRAAPEWFDISVNDLGVSATLFDYDYDEAELEGTIRELATVAREYLAGGGHIEWTRHLIRGPRPRLRIQTGQGEWVLGRRTSHIPYPSMAKPPETFDEALEEVERQLREMPLEEVAAGQDLEWTFGRFYVVAKASGTRPTVVDIEASRGVIRRAVQRRTVTLD
jgi:hypothetical protein